MKNSDKTVMIITWCDADNIVNYGQVLQGCAMAKTIGKMGFKKVIFVSYRERGAKEILDYLYLHYSPFLENSRAYHGTRRFIRQIMKEGNIEFHQVFTERRVMEIANRADILVCGSDQIWHPIEYCRALFLDIGRKSAKRIAYAASQPMGTIYPEYKLVFEKMARHLKRFDAISVREKGVVPLFEKMSGMTVENVTDPTLLISKEEWSILCEPVKLPKEYILLYIPADMNKMTKDVVLSVKEQSGIRHVICLAPRCKKKIQGIGYLNDVSTGQFITLVKNATIVCTSSFHGVIFSIIFERPFWCFKWRFSDRRSDLRLEQITQMSGLTKRLLKSAEEIDISSKIDYNECNQKMKKQIEKSYEFLEKNVTEKKGKNGKNYR